MRRFLALGGLFLTVLALCYACLVLFRGNAVVAAVWLANAVTLAFMLRWSSQAVERLLAFGAAFLAMMGANLLWGRTVVEAVVFAMANGAEIAMAAACLWRMRMPITGPRAFALFVVSAVIAAPIISGGLAALFVKLFEHNQPATSLLRWTAGDAVGMLVLGPFLLTITKPDRASLRLSTWGWTAVTQTLLAAVAIRVFAFADTPAMFMVFPFLVLAAVANPALGGVLAILVTTAVAMVCTMIGRGPTMVAGLLHLDRVLVMQGFIVATVMTVLPVTALLRKLSLYAQELERARAEAEDLNAIKTKLLAHVSHEIRSPLSGVTSMAELMRDGMMGELTEQQRETLGQMAQNGAEVEALARDLLDAATLQSGKASIHLSDVDVEDAVETAVASARYRAKQHGGSIVVVGSYCGDIKVSADRLRLRQILINLLVNGLKYGGSPPVVQVSAYATERGTVRFEVADNGEGLSPKQRETLFKSFDRLGAEKSDIEGAGLGLALSRELAELQGGGLGVEDSDLGGALFWLELPQAEMEQITAKAA